MALSKKVREAVIETLAEAEKENITPLELGIRLRDCLKKKVVWLSHAGELSEDSVYRISGGTLQRLPLVNFLGHKLAFVYRKPKIKKSPIKEG